MQLELALIPHKVENKLVNQRAADGYINATAMCNAVGKKFADYSRLTTTRAFLVELSRSMGIPIDLLVHTVSSGSNESRGTWVHPDVAINLGQWCSPKFAVAVSKWVREWLTNTIAPTSLPPHIQRYMINRAEIPPTHFSMLNELTFALVAPLEAEGYVLPEKMVPDISTGRMFSKWLREVKELDTDTLPSYQHRFADGRVVQARLYPNQLLADFRRYFHLEWLPYHAGEYFSKRDQKAMQHLPKLLPNPKRKLGR